MLKVGDRMPFFEVMDQNGNKFNSLQLLGRKTIIYFIRRTIPADVQRRHAISETIMQGWSQKDIMS